MDDFVVLVNEEDEVRGKMEKMEAHRLAELHRAFSIFIFNDANELLLQIRAMTKYHSAGKWSNTCCSHPRPGETTKEAADRRLVEEMGFSTSIKEVFSFIYKEYIGGDMTEHEFDHVFLGRYNGEVLPNPTEVCDYKFVSILEVSWDVEMNPEDYTAWFKICFKEVIQSLLK